MKPAKFTMNSDIPVKTRDIFVVAPRDIIE